MNGNALRHVLLTGFGVFRTWFFYPGTIIRAAHLHRPYGVIALLFATGLGGLLLLLFNTPTSSDTSIHRTILCVIGTMMCFMSFFSEFSATVITSNPGIALPYVPYADDGKYEVS